MTGAAPHPLADPRWLAAARRRPALWRLGLGILLALAVYVGGIALLVPAGALVVGWPEAAGFADRVATGEDPAAILALLATFGLMAAGAWAAARLLHGRRLREMVGPAGPAWRDFRDAAGVTLALGAASLALALGTGDAVRAMEPARWALLLLPAVPLLLLQTGAEELLFRGYLQGQLAARFRSPLIWAALPSLAFGALHWDPSLGWPAGYYVAATAVFGLIAADLTALTGRLGAAWGLHFANNVFPLALLGTPGSLPGLALWRLPGPLAEMEGAGLLIALDTAVLVAIWAAIRALIRRRLQREGAANTSHGSAPGAPR